MDANTIHYMQIKSEINKCEKYRTQGFLGILIGIVSLPSAIFIHWLCGVGMIFGLAGVILVIINWIKLNDLKGDMATLLAKK